MHEEWRDIEGYKGFYQVSNLGNVRSLDRTYVQPDSHGGIMEKKYHGHLLHPTNNGSGYLIVPLTKNGEKRKNHYVHRLVAEAFIPNPCGCDQINHKDYNKKNNSADNLEWMTRLENVLYSVKNMEKPKINAKPTATGERYITNKGKLFRLNIQRKSLRIDKLFRTLEEAVNAREVLIGD